MAGVLEQHGTKLCALKASSIVAAARADLAKVSHKRAKRLDRYEPYCFHRTHVRAAKSAADLISRALDDRERGLSSGKKATRLIYGDQELLAAALIASRGGGGEDAPA